MNCKEIRVLLTTDYIDDELGEGAKNEVAGHLESCPRCRQFEEAVRHAAVEPFRSEQLRSAPASVWYQIKRRIKQEQAGASHAGLPGAWQSLFRVRKAAVAAALAAAVIVVLFVVQPPTPPPPRTHPSSADVEEAHDYIREQFLAFSYQGDNGSRESAEGENGYNNIASVDFGTVVEEYLL